MSIADGQLVVATDHLNHNNVFGYLQLGDRTTLTIVAGVVTQVANYHLIDTEGGASTDDLDTIALGGGFGDGAVLVLAPASDARTIVIRHATGNIRCIGNQNVTLADEGDAALLVYQSNLASWLCLSISEVNTAMIAELAVTSSKLAANAVTSIAIAAVNVTTDKLADLNVTLAKIANDAVDDTKVGNRVPQFYRRQGGSATNWSTQGITNYTPTAVRMQGGVMTTQIPVSALSVAATVTFPEGFSDAPFVIAWPFAGGMVAVDRVVTYGSGATATQFTLNVARATADPNTLSVYVAWLAIGPE